MRYFEDLTESEKIQIKLKCWEDYHEGNKKKESVFAWVMETFDTTLHVAKRVTDLTVADMKEINKIK
jgi:phage/plasmid primase-like uncharacterized protein